MSRTRDALLSAVLLAVGRRRPKPGPEARRVVPELPRNPGAELLVLLLLGLSSLSAIAFVVLYAVLGSVPAPTQLLGLALGLAVLFLAAALIVVARKLIVTEEVVEEYPAQEHPYEQQLIAEVVEESGSRFTRLGLFKLGLLGAGGTLALALITPALSFGPLFQVKYFLGTPWRRGRRLVDENGRPYKASDIELDDFYTAFPEGIPEADKEEEGAPLIVIRLPVSQLRLPPELKGYDASGVVAYSKICTHAGCAISMLRAPLFQPTSPKPALVCPCHYSTFDPADGGTVVFGPAGRKLPMLPVFVDSTKEIVYSGSYAPLRGQHVTEAYASVVHLSLDVKAGLLIRQTHHWAANVFVAAIILHLFRIFFTGAYRKPRGLTYFIGVTMLMVALLEAYLGYSLVDDLMSGMGLVIGYSVGLSIPFVGANLMSWLFHGPYPGQASLWPRMYIAHILLFPILIGLLLGLHLALVAMKHHTQFRRTKRETEHSLVGVPLWPGQTPRSVGLALATAGVLFLLGGLVEINPIWLWGPYHVYESTNGAQPDWYLGWLIGGLRLVPGFDVVIGSYTLVPGPFWGGALFPLVVFGFLYFWPWIERKATGDHAFHNVLDRPRDAPVRTGIGVGVVTWVVLVFLAGGSDRVDVLFGISYTAQIWVYRVIVWVFPVVFGVVAWRFCKELQAGERVIADRHRAEAEARLARTQA